MSTQIDVLAEAERRLTRLARENARLKNDANRLRARVEPGQWTRILENAYEDARLILHLKNAGNPVSRRWMDEAGLVSAWRYGWALGLLRYARIDRTRVRTLEELDEALQTLEASVEWLRENASDRLMEVRVKCGRKYMLNRY